jgi:hypothetical protein
MIVPLSGIWGNGYAYPTGQLLGATFGATHVTEARAFSEFGPAAMAIGCHLLVTSRRARAANVRRSVAAGVLCPIARPVPNRLGYDGALAQVPVAK